MQRKENYSWKTINNNELKHEQYASIHITWIWVYEGGRTIVLCCCYCCCSLPNVGIIIKTKRKQEYLILENWTSVFITIFYLCSCEKLWKFSK